MENNNPLNDSIENIKKMQDAVNGTAKESEDVKSGRCTEEEELKEPGYILYNQITESTIKILQQPEISSAFVEFGKKFGEETSKSLVTLFAVAMSESAHNAILFYDDLLKKELTGNFDTLTHHINLCKADIEGHTAVLELFRKQLNEIQEKIKLEEFKKNNHVND